MVCDPHLVASLLSRDAALDKPFACKAFAEGYFPISVVRLRAGWVPGARAVQAPCFTLLGAADQQPREDAEHAHK